MTRIDILEAQPVNGTSVVSAAGSLALLGANILIFLGLFSLAPALPAIKVHFGGVPYVDILTQLVGASAGFTFAIGSPFIGRAIAHYGYKPIYLISLLTFAMAGTAGGLFDNLYAIIATRAIVGAACSGMVNAALVAISKLIRPDAQARTLGLQGLIAGIVSLFAFPAIGQLAATDWKLSFAPHLIALLFVPLVMLLPVARGSSDADGPMPAAKGVGGVILASAAFVGMVTFISTVFGPLFLVSLGISGAALLSLPPMASSVGSLAGAASYVVLRPRAGLAMTFAISITAMAIGLVVAGLSTGAWGVAAGSLIASFGSGLFAPNLNSAAIAASPENPGPTLGLVNALLYGVIILFPFIAAPLVSFAGGLKAVPLFYAGIGVVFVLLFATGLGTRKFLRAA